MAYVKSLREDEGGTYGATVQVITDQPETARCHDHLV